MRKLLFLFYITIFINIFSSSQPLINRGRLDLSGFGFEGKEIALSGEWEFYKGKIITPGYFSDAIPDYVMIPGSVENFNTIENRAVGTYRTVIDFRLRETNRLFGVRLSDISSNFKLWIDGELAIEYGNMKLINNNYYLGIRDEIAFFKPSKKRIEIVFNINNHPSIVNNGFNEKILIGYKEEVLKNYNSVKYGIFLLSVGMVLISIYTFVLYSVARYPENISYFAMFSIIIAIDVLVNSKTLALLDNYFPISFRVEFLYRLDVITTMLGAFLLIKYFRAFKGRITSDKYNVALEIFTSVLALWVFLIPNEYILINEQKIKLFVVICYVAFGLPIIHKSQKEFEGLDRWSLNILLIFAAIAILVAYHEVIFFAYILIESMIIMFRYSKSFLEKQKIAVELKEINETLDDKVKRRTMQLEEKTKQLEQVNSAKTKFFSVISHELRTPLNGIIGMSQLLYLEKLPLNLKRKIDVINNTSNHLLKIINDILDASKLEFNKMTLEKSAYDLREMIYKLSDSFSYLLNEKGLILITEIDDEVPAIINGDSMRLRQVLLNLIGNSVKFTENGYVKVRVKMQGDKIYFAVEDTGIGISKERAKDIFDDYNQDRLSDARKYGGTGLGLSISKQIVELMESELLVDIEREFGSKFFFEISAKEVMKFEREKLENKTLMIIHSDYTVNRYLMKWSDSWNISSIPFYNLDEAMEIELEDFEDEDLYIIIEEEILESKFDNFVDYILYYPNVRDNVIIISKSNKKSIDFESYGITKLVDNPINMEKFYNIMKFGKSYYDVHIEETKKTEKFKGKKALIVEDNEVNIEVLKETLEIMKFEVSYVKSGMDALITILNTSYDIIFMDVELEDISGIEVTKLIRYGENKNINTKIVAVTAYTSDDYREVCISSGMDYYLAKPIDNKELYNLLNKVFEEIEIDISELQKLSSDESMRKVMNNLFQFYPKSISKIYTYIAEKEESKAKKELHNLKGAVSNIRVDELTDRIREFEREYDTLTEEKRFKLIEAIETELEKIRVFYERKV